MLTAKSTTLLRAAHALNFILIVLILSPSAMAEDKEFDFGVGAGAITVPHYMGSAEHYQLVLPIPMMLPTKNAFFDNKIFFFDATADINLPVNSDSITAETPDDYDNRNGFIVQKKNFTRRGMEDIPWAFYLGLKAGLNIGPITLEASTTPGIFIGDGWDSAGLQSKLRFTWHTLVQNSGDNISCLCFFFEGIYADKKYNQAYYGVESKDAIADRPEFSADKAGYLGSKIGFYFVKRMGALAVMGYLSVQDMNGSVVKDSPLVRRKTGSTTAIALTLMF